MADRVLVSHSTAIYIGDQAMTLDEFRKEMEAFRGSVDEEARSLRAPYVVSEEFSKLYQSFGDSERAMADQVLAEWVLSEEEGVRYDALALISEFKITTTVQVLRKLASRLALSCTPGAPFELEWVNRIISEHWRPN